MKFFLSFYLFVIFVLFNLIAVSQQLEESTQDLQYKLDQFDQNRGLDNPFIYTIDQAENGYLLVGTGEGVGMYDGEEFKMYYTSDGLAENFVSSSFNDSKGNIWFGHKQGGVSIYDGRKFDLVHSGGGINSVINDIDKDDAGLMWFAAQDFGIFCVNEDGKFNFFNDQFEGQLIYSLTITESNYIFIGTDRGVEVYKYYSEENILSKVQKISNLPDDQVSSILEVGPNKLLISTLSSGLFWVEQKEDVFKTTSVKFKNLDEFVIVRDISVYDNWLWISTLQTGLLRCEIQGDDLLVVEKYYTGSGLRSDAINTMFIDREGVTWIGTFGEGLASKGDNLFTFYFKKPNTNYSVKDIYVKDEKIWLASKGEVVVRDKHTLTILNRFGALNGLPNDEISCIEVINDSLWFVGTENRGVYKFENSTNSFKNIQLSGDDLSMAITSITSLNDKIWIGTLNGVYRMGIYTEGIVSYGISSGLSHNSVGDVLITKSGQVYIGTRSAFLSKYNDELFENIQLSEEFNVVTVNMMIESTDGAIWISTSDNGVFRVKETVTNITVSDGLESNYCYGIEQDINGRVWVTHNGGLTRIEYNEGDYIIEVYGAKHGVGTRFLRSSIFKYNDQLWFGSENGIVLYSASEDKQNMVPPLTSFSSVVINEKEYAINEDIVLPYGEYDIQVFFKGISLKKSSKVKYQFILEGHQNNWSESTTINNAKYIKVLDGEYTFRVKSFNSDGIAGEETYFKISIAQPFWKKWWFYLVIIFIIAIVFVIIIKSREKRYIRYQKELEHQLALRTKEVVHQKEEIEEINKDLTDSINYAKRIQTAILPEEDEFHEMFPNNFIFYKPKDIVSGDFYWAKKFDNLSLVVCADCTGHGVPGGFMSMIGTMLLYETCVLKNILDPAEILKDLDFNLKQVLRQNDDFESNKDGMDLSLCIIDTDTNILYSSAAMRPIYVYREGLQNIIKADRYSLGGTIVKNKEFTTNKFELLDGDVIYLFSDGFADQFGGPYTRKMKVTGMVELLDQVSTLPIEVQQEEISEFFEEWKGTTAQMDDVLVIGIKHTYKA